MLLFPSTGAQVLGFGLVMRSRCLGQGQWQTKESLLGPLLFLVQESKYVDLVSKHDFSRVTFGMMCGMMYDILEELIILHCSDWFQVQLPSAGRC